MLEPSGCYGLGGEASMGRLTSGQGSSAIMRECLLVYGPRHVKGSCRGKGRDALFCELAFEVAFGMAGAWK